MSRGLGDVYKRQGRKLTFKVGACDDHGPIGNGTHERFIIDKAKFIAKLQSKR